MNILDEIKTHLSSRGNKTWSSVINKIPEYKTTLEQFFNCTETKINVYCLMNGINSIPLSACGLHKKYREGIFLEYCNNYKIGKELSCMICHEHRTKLSLTRRKETNIKLFGTPHALQNHNIKNKQAQTNIDRYGYNTPLLNSDVKQKIDETNLERYGTCNIASSNIIKERAKKTNLIKYGHEFSFQSSVIKDKSRQTCIDRYGTEYYQQSDIWKYKTNQHNLIKYGTKTFFESEIYRDFKSDYLVNMRKNRLEQKLPDYEIMSDLKTITSVEHHVFKHTVCGTEFSHHAHTRNRHAIKCPKCFNTQSVFEIELKEFISSIYSGTIIHNDRSVLKSLELDIYLPDIKIAFEVNGIYWHSDKFKDKKYHQEKHLECANNEIRLISIFEDEMVHKKELIYSRINNMINNSVPVYARKCTVHEIPYSESIDYLNENHIQGTVNASITLVLKDENLNIVQLMSFGKSRFKQSSQYELLRLCSNSRVIGGASKLLKYFERTYNPKSITSYADMNWSIGAVYEVLGFTRIKYTQPDYYYCTTSYKRLSRYQCQKKNLIKKYGFNSKLTEKEMTTELKYLKIYGCGSYVYKKEYK